MTDPTSDPTTPPDRAASTDRKVWPDDSIDMRNEMRAEQARSLHDMFSTLRDHSKEAFEKWPYEAQDYIRLALRAQANCRMTMADIDRIELAAKSRADAEK